MRHAAKLAIGIITIVGIACASPTGPTSHDCSGGGSQQWDKCMQTGATAHR